MLGLLLVIGGGALLVAWLPPLTLLWTAAAISGLGCLIGFPCGFIWHLALRREVLNAGKPLPRGWLWYPMRLQAELNEDARRRVWRWGVLGALGFVLIMAGAALATLALVTHF